MSLTLNQIEYVCLTNDKDGKKCRYLACDRENNVNEWICLKKTSNKIKIDKQVEEFILNNKDYILSMQDIPPLGDNCKGFPVMRYLKQGI
jgi:hypothetical protein